MKALVTGVAGFVGSSLARRLIDEGHQVVGIDALTPYYAQALKQHNLSGLNSTSFDFYQDDLNEVNLDALLDGVDVVFHQAGQPGVRGSWGHAFKEYARNNIMATQRLLEAVTRSVALKKFVYASSSSVYGNAARFPTLEADAPQPVSPYGVTKLAAEHLATLYGTNFGVPTISLRYFTVYGPGQRPDMAFTRFVQSAVSERRIRVFGTGDQIRDFTYIDDVVAANLLAADSVGLQPGEVVNISGGSNISVNDVLAIIGSLAGRQLNVERLERAQGDVFRTGGASDRAQEMLGWRSQVTVEEGLERQFQWALDTEKIWSALPENEV